jgi:hypothetical protein
MRLPSQEGRRLWSEEMPQSIAFSSLTGMGAVTRFFHTVPVAASFRFEEILMAVVLSQVRARVALMLPGVQ